MRTQFLAAVAALLPPGAHALQLDSPAEGFALTALPYPGSAATATLEDGRIVAFDGLTLSLHLDDGSLVVSWLGYGWFVKTRRGFADVI